jgi:hypothetical protein
MSGLPRLMSRWRHLTQLTDDRLEANIAAAESLADWGAAAVVLGLVIEFAFAVVFAPAEIYRQASFLEHWGTVLGDALVAGGVAIEVIFSKLASLSHAEIRRRSDERAARAAKEAGDAHDRAAKAEKAAAEARERAANAEKETENLRAQVYAKRGIMGPLGPPI